MLKRMNHFSTNEIIVSESNPDLTPSGGDSPAGPYAQVQKRKWKLWINSFNKTFFVRKSRLDNEWAGPYYLGVNPLPYRRVTASGVLSVTDEVVKVNGGLTVSLPNPTTTLVGKVLYISRYPGAGTVTVNVSGGSQLENSGGAFALTQTLTSSKCAWINNGTNWLMISST